MSGDPNAVKAPPNAVARISRGNATIRPLVPFDCREAMSLREAAEVATLSARTITRLCQSLKIGRKIGGEWRVSRVGLQIYLDDDGRALMAFQRGERTSQFVAPYFFRFGLLDDCETRLGNSDNSDKHDISVMR